VHAIHLDCLRAHAADYALSHQVIRTRLREERGVNKSTLKYGSLLNAFQVIAREEGLRGLYGGMGTHLVRVVPNSAILFLTYEVVSAYLNSRSSAPAALSSVSSE